MWCVNKGKYSPRLGLPQNQSHLYSKVLYTLFFFSSLSYGQPAHPQRDKGGNHLTLSSWCTPTGCYTWLHEVISGNFLSNICYLAWDWWCCSTCQWTPRTTSYFALFRCRLPQTSHSALTWLVSWRVALSASKELLCVTSLHYNTLGARSCWSIIEKDQENCIWKKWSNYSRLCSSNGSVHSRTTRISWWGF